MKSIISIVLVLIGGFFLIAADSFEKKKKVEYKNDERWKEIVRKSKNKVMRYFNFISLVACLLSLVFQIFDNLSFKVELVDVLQVIFIILLFRYPVEYFSLKYFDKNI
ncbi:hypothetical protein [Enterococcus sp.]|uniref:hypothetical protein n=1 Tax=Enterococcus sp. TaxID=35783 RepID=UPI00291488B4|nr:hypothetical protein [Enterococcus sp.]MDU5336992.1 hypothetical protein [Enterococcus sp.]